MGCIAYHTTPLGRIMLAAEGDALVGLWMEGQKYFAGSLKGEFRERNDFPVLVRGREWLDRYFAGEKPHVSELKLDPAGSEFRKAVWKILCQIPYGEVTTYGEIAKKIADKKGVRLVYLSARVDLLNSKETIGSGPEEFVSLFRHACFVVCTSFHGTVFSCIFHVPFYSVLLDLSLIHI